LATFKWENDYYLVTHDFDDYCRAQSLVDQVYRDKREWTRRSILCTAGMGKFSTDRTIAEYAKDIWGLAPARRADPVSVTREHRVTARQAPHPHPPAYYLHPTSLTIVYLPGHGDGGQVPLFSIPGGTFLHLWSRRRCGALVKILISVNVLYVSKFV